jgi:hypothetical protein
MRIHPTPPYESFPDCMHPQEAFPRYRMPGISPDQVVQLPHVYLQSRCGHWHQRAGIVRARGWGSDVGEKERGRAAASARARPSPHPNCRPSHIWGLWDRAADAVLAKHQELVAAGRPANTTVVLDLPCPFLAVM